MKATTSRKWRRRALALGASLTASAVIAAPASAGKTTTTTTTSTSTSASSNAGIASLPLKALAKSSPSAQAQIIAQFSMSTTPDQAAGLIRQYGGTPGAQIKLIHGYSATMPAGQAVKLAAATGTRVVSLNARVKQTAFNTKQLATSYPYSLGAPTTWADYGLTGKGVGVAVIDTGIAGDLADFRTSQTDRTSRVVASVTTNPAATTATDRYGHGTHVAGIIAGNGNNRDLADPLFGKYVGVAPDADLISIKAGDENGDATILDVINGLEFVVAHKSALNIRVVNLSLESDQAQSYTTDPLNAAVEQAWLNGVVVVAAAGNRGSATNAVQYAPGNDPYVISVGAVDDQGTTAGNDDVPASWSSRGTTQDGFAKPELVAPGARVVSALSPNSQFQTMAPGSIVDGQYIRAGGTSMAAPMVAGVAALILQQRPDLTPDQVKGVLMKFPRIVGSGTSALKEPDLKAIYTELAKNLAGSNYTANVGLTPNTLIDPATGSIDYTRSSWSRSSWSTAPADLVAGWARSSWSCTTCGIDLLTGTVDSTRSSWSRSSWSTEWSF